MKGIKEMELYTWLIEKLLPFEWASLTFMKNALLAIILVSTIFSILGNIVVNNRMVFFSDAIGHSALTGIAIGVILGFNKPIWAMVIFSIIFAVCIVLIKNKSYSTPDTLIGVFSSTAIALGIVILSYNGRFSKYSSYLIGDILSITSNEIILLFFVLIALVLLWYFVFNNLLLTSINQSLASSRGINTKLIDIIFTSLIAIVITISIQWIGLLIINSLLILPAAASRNIAKNTRQYFVFSLLISIISGVLGLIFSYYLNTSTGATIVLITALFYFISLIMHNFGRRYQ